MFSLIFKRADTSSSYCSLRQVLQNNNKNFQYQHVIKKSLQFCKGSPCSLCMCVRVHTCLCVCACRGMYLKTHNFSLISTQLGCLGKTRECFYLHLSVLFRMLPAKFHSELNKFDQNQTWGRQSERGEVERERDIQGSIIKPKDSETQQEMCLTN